MKFDFSVFPNPVNDWFVLQIPNYLNKTFEVEIVNLLGQKVYQNKFSELSNSNLEINLESLASSTYILSVKCITTGEIVSKKIQKK